MEFVPLTGTWSRRRFVNEMSGGEATQCTRVCPITAPVSEFAFVEHNHAGCLRLDLTEPYRSIKPERARFDTLFIVTAELVRLDRKYSAVEILSQETKQTRLDPRRLSITEA